MTPADKLTQLLTELMAALRRTGVVTGTAGTKVIVTVQGSSVVLPRLSTYTPVVGDTVVIQGPAPYIVLGKPA